MDGKTARLFVEQLVRAATSANVVNPKRTYDLLHMGAEEFCSLTGAIKDSQTITTVASTANYDLDVEYLRLYLKTEDPRGGAFFIHYNDGTTTHTLEYKAYQKVIYDNQTTAQAVPGNFTLHAKTSAETQLSSSVTSAGALSGGQATLADSAASFSGNVRDIVHNSTKDATGIVLSVTSTTALVTAIFTHNGEPVGWDTGDSYIIQPAPRTRLQFDPPPSTASHTATVYFIAKPAPVYSDYGTWLVNDIYHKAFCYYAAHLYLIRYDINEADGKPLNAKASNDYRREFNDIVHRAKREIDISLGKTGYSMRTKA